MRIGSIEIINYRSITVVKRIPINNYSIILGKNNEGKTNVLNAIRLALSTLAHKAKVRESLTIREFRETQYNYERDFPVSLQKDDSANETVLKIEFILNNEDVDNFKNIVGSHINGRIGIKIVYKKEGPEFSIMEKRGAGAASFKNKIDVIINFIVGNINFKYIPAIRTQNDSLQIINGIVDQELMSLDDDIEYKQASEIIKNKQEHILKEICDKIKSSLKIFLPDLLSTEIELTDERRLFRRDINFYVDDGTKTNISYKGDGVKSLVTLALLNRLTIDKKSRIIAIEEPESHLHPEAIHQINKVIESLAENSQVIITTHNPSFVNTNNIQSNILIDKGKGREASNIDEIRQLLGVKLSDNLSSANLVIIVEGPEDVVAFKHILMQKSLKITNAIKNKQLQITDLGGASNLRYKCSLLKTLMCNYYVILDGDRAGVEAYNIAQEKGFVNTLNSTILYAYGNKKESEFEDIVRKDLYQSMILNDYGVNLHVGKFKGCKNKWSDRLKKTFVEQGKYFDDKTEAEIKEKISKIIEKSTIKNVIEFHYLEIIDNLVNNLEKIL